MKETSIRTIFDAVTIPASGSSTSEAIGLNMVIGHFSIQTEVAGDGTAKFEYLCSNNGVNFLKPSGVSDITSGVTKTSGPGSDGKDIFDFFPKLARFLKIKITETSTTNSITATVFLAVQ